MIIFLLIGWIMPAIVNIFLLRMLTKQGEYYGYLLLDVISIIIACLLPVSSVILCFVNISLLELWCGMDGEDFCKKIFFIKDKEK